MCKGVAVPPSLRNMYTELESDKDVKPAFKRPAHGYLMEWAERGVLLINTVLTVRQAEANSHRKQGWEKFTDALVDAVDKKGGNGNGLVFLLFGKPAETKAKKVDAGKHRLIKVPHPSPLSAHRGFMGSQVFSRCNAQLEELDVEPIDWSLSP